MTNLMGRWSKAQSVKTHTGKAVAKDIEGFVKDVDNDRKKFQKALATKAHDELESLIEEIESIEQLIKKADKLIKQADDL